jgi:hypothetical protein
MSRFVLLLFLPLFLFASTDTNRALKMMKVEQRIALVIGNNQYDHKRLSTLQNPINDARSMKAKLEQLGFTVIYGENLKVRDMDRKLDQFTGKLKQGGVGLFFFAGHGVEYRGINYLMGKDSNVDNKDDVKWESLPLNKALEAMENAGNRFNIVMLDACRNDPFSRSSGGGLAKSTARGTLIAYATSPGDVASDGSGSNGVFTENILKYIDEPGLEIHNMFKKVKRGVFAQTRENQRPWTNSDVMGDFFFLLPDGSSDFNKLNVTSKKSTNKFHMANSQKKKAQPDSITYTDLDTRLMWQDNIAVTTVKKDWNEANEYCQNMTLGGYSDWYLPSEEQLFSLYKKKEALQHLKEWSYWSSSLNRYSSVNAKYVYFLNGNSYENPKSEMTLVRCTRYISNTDSQKFKTNLIKHNGLSYGIVKSPYTGRIWLDRNLGAKRVCQSFDDKQCYGDYYQWGRAADGHEKARSSNFTTVRLSSDDWKESDSSGSQRHAYWSRTDGSGICPTGFRVPTVDELEAETLDHAVKNRNDAFNNFLKLPSAGNRNFRTGSMYDQEEDGSIWFSSHTGKLTRYLGFDSEDAGIYGDGRAYGFSVRCLKE